MNRTSRTQYGDSQIGDLFDQLLSPNPPPFAVLRRHEESGPGRLEILTGITVSADNLADLPLRTQGSGTHGKPDLLTLIPYRQVAERGFDCIDDGAPLVGIQINGHHTVSVDEFNAAVAESPLRIRHAQFDLDDKAYRAAVQRVIDDEIGRGEGANFVMKRTFQAAIDSYSVSTGLQIYRRLLASEPEAYWTFLVYTGERTLIGASPERHLTIAGGVATMNPISGTYRRPRSGITLAGVLDFLADRKESEELYMVLDEELKMMGRICESGGRVLGPRLKEMAQLVHTEYYISGRPKLGVLASLRETLFAPTVVGSPLESAFRVIARNEYSGRGYYSGVLALIGQDTDGAATLDSTIIIRTADIADDGRVRLDVGATVVRHSDPQAEADETRAKAAALLVALGINPYTAEVGPVAAEDQDQPPNNVHDHPAVHAGLIARNRGLGGFWFASADDGVDRRILDGNVLVIDCEDTFSWMLRHQLQAMGLQVSVQRFDEPIDLARQDLVILGPGPGDPRDVQQTKIAEMRRHVESAMRLGTPLLAICLGHQVLSGMLGLDLVRKDTPNQGVQIEIDLFGRKERCGFYNTFAARAEADVWSSYLGPAQLARDHRTGEVHAIRGPGFASVQFHPESVLTENGVQILYNLVSGIIETVELSA